MNQLKLLRYAQESAIRKCRFCDDVAHKFKGDTLGEMAREMANYIMNDVKEIEVMIDVEEKRLRAEAEKQHKQEQAARVQQAQQEKAPQQQARPTAGRIVDDGTDWIVAIQYKDGLKTASQFSCEDVARKAYETIRMLDKKLGKSNLSRMTLTKGENIVVKVYERD